MISSEPTSGASNLEFIAWDTLNALLETGAPLTSYMPRPGQPNLDFIMWDILQNIGGGGGGGGLPIGFNGAVLHYQSDEGGWHASSRLYDDNFIPTIALDIRSMFDSGFTRSMNWDSRQLLDTSELLAVDYRSRELYHSNGNLIVDWEAGGINDSSGAAAFAFSSRSIIDASGRLILNGIGRILLDAGGDQVFNFADLSGSNKAFFYSSFKVGFGAVGTEPQLTHSVTIGTPGIRFNGLNTTARATADTGGLIVNINGVDKVINYKDF